MKDNKGKNRMIEILKSMEEEKHEVYKGPDDIAPDVNPSHVKEAFERFKEIAKIDKEEKSEINEANVTRTHPQAGLKQYGPGLNNMTLGTTVNTFMMDVPGKTVNTFLENPNQGLASKNHNPKYTYLQPAEALRLAVSRVLSSGAPIADISFYDEVNWNLNNLGFDSKSPLDIKQSILKMIKD